MKIQTAEPRIKRIFLPKGSISLPFASVDPILVEFLDHIEPSIATAPPDF
jgi:hypothetical protein